MDKIKIDNKLLYLERKPQNIQSSELFFVYMIYEIPAIFQTCSLAHGQNSRKMITFFRSEMPSQLQVFQLPASFKLDGMTSLKQCLAAKHSFKIAASKVNIWTSLKTNLFIISGTL